MISWPQQEGVPREWWAIEPRFFQPKVPPWYAQNQNTGQTLSILLGARAPGKVLGAVPEES